MIGPEPRCWTAAFTKTVSTGLDAETGSGNDAVVVLDDEVACVPGFGFDID